MKRWDIVNHLIKENNYKKYLEIGTARGTCFKKINCKYKVGVDPKGIVGLKMTSNQFFKKNKEKFDIVFIDGLHIYKQVIKDIHNSLKCLKKNGIIVLHDCNPPTWKHQAVPRIQKSWNGTVWKAIVRLRCKNLKLFMCVIDTDWGCGIIKRGNQNTYSEAELKECLTWDYFTKHKKELLNLISISDFLDEN